MLYTDRAVFNQSHVGLTQADIEKLLTIGSYTISDSAGLAIIPRDPRVPLCIENAVLVTRERRRKLLGILAECGPDDYLEQMKEGEKPVVMDASGSDTVSDGFMEVPDTLTNSLSEDNADASFIDACNMLPDVMTLPVCA